jgi:hypothetical protein
MLLVRPNINLCLTASRLVCVKAYYEATILT